MSVKVPILISCEFSEYPSLLSDSKYSIISPFLAPIASPILRLQSFSFSYSSGFLDSLFDRFSDSGLRIPDSKLAISCFKLAIGSVLRTTGMNAQQA